MEKNSSTDKLNPIVMGIIFVSTSIPIIGFLCVGYGNAAGVTSSAYVSLLLGYLFYGLGALAGIFAAVYIILMRQLKKYWWILLWYIVIYSLIIMSLRHLLD